MNNNFISFDCGVHTLGYVCGSFDTLHVINQRIFDKRDINITKYETIDLNCAKNDHREIAAKLIPILANIAMAQNTTIYIERQMSPNFSANIVFTLIIGYYTIQNKHINIVEPSYKNTVAFHPELIMSKFMSYDMNIKDHTYGNFKYITNDKRPKSYAGHCADALLQVFGYIAANFAEYNNIIHNIDSVPNSMTFLTIMANLNIKLPQRRFGRKTSDITKYIGQPLNFLI
jgi:hypothetical protein